MTDVGLSEPGMKLKERESGRRTAADILRDRVRRLIPGPRRMRQLRSYALVWSMLPLFVLLVIVAGFAYTAYRDAAADVIVERDLQLAYLSAARLEDELSKFSDELAAIARTDDVRDGDSAERRAALDRARLRLSVFDGGVILLDELGRVRAAQPDRPDVMGRDWSSRVYFRDLLSASSTVYAHSDIDGPEGSPAVVIAVPILGGSGEFHGALLGLFRLGQSTISPFYASIVRLRIGQTGETYLVDAAGKILYEPTLRSYGAQFSEHAIPGLTLDSQGGALRTVDAAGNDVLAAYVPIPGTSWMLVTEDDWSMVTRSTRSYLRMFLMVLGLGMVLPALGVAVLARQYGQEVLERERLDQEARVSEIIQRTLLPDSPPVLPGWRIASRFMPSALGRCGFYDWHILDDGVVMLTLGDVSKKRMVGIPVLATLRGVLRARAVDGVPPSESLRAANDVLCAGMPQEIAVTCVHLRLDPSRGHLQFATGGHLGPYHDSREGLVRVDADGPELGASLGAGFAERDLVIEPGQRVILASVGLVEARNSRGEAFGDSRLAAITAEHREPGQDLAAAVMTELRDFTGYGWEPDADVILLVLERVATAADDAQP